MLLKMKVKVVELRDSSGTIERKTKVHAQRKFAQGSPSFIIARDREAKENGFSNHISHPNGVTVPDMAQDVMLDKCPRTDDFLSFLCFRGSDILPESLNFFGDPLLHNYPDGRPPTPEAPKTVPNNSVPAKLENGHKAESKAGDNKSPLATQPVVKAPEKKSAPLTNGNNKKKNANTQPKNKVTSALKITKKIITPLQKPNLSRIHSNFRRSTNLSRILTRRILGKTDSPSPANKKNVAKTMKANKKTNASPRKVLTRLQKRSNSNQQESDDSSSSSSESSSRNESSSEEESSEAESSSSSEPSPPVKNSKQTAKTMKKSKSNKAKTTSSKKSVKAPSPISKNTRLSTKSNQMSSPASLALKKVGANSLKNSPTTRKALRDASVSKPSPSSSLRRISTTTVSPSKTSEKSPASSPSKMTREAARKLAASTKSSPLPIPSIASRRPSRRTKEAATFYMTLIGQEEDLNSSEVEEEASKEESNSNLKKKKTPSVDSNRKRAASPPPSPIRTRRAKASSSSSVSGSSEAKKRVILKEAAKRFTAVQSSSSSEESSDSSSSEEEDEKVKTPQRNIKTRSFDPAKASSNSTGIAGIIRLPEQSPLRQTRAASNKKSVPPTKPPPAKSKKAAPIKAEPAARKRPVPASRTVVTPPLNYDISSLLEAPVFYPSEKEFTDPLEYLAKIREESERFGICRIVPPASFKPECQLADGMRFTAYNQYVHRMFRRRGANSRVLEAIHLHLEAQDINCHPPPCIGGIEVDLPGLYNAVENLGGPGDVMVHGLWSTVADMLKIPRASPDRLSKLDTIYCKYLLPYATLSEDERNKLLQEADARHLERQGKRLEDDEEEDDDDNESIVKSSSTALNTFYRVARNTLALWFPSSSSGNADAVSVVDPEKAEATYWKLVTERDEHVCVHSANIDSGQSGYGFPCNKSSRHPWNLKVLTNNNGSVLRSLGSVPGCTAPTLHVGMLFSASCWYRDPHGLPWIDYLHTGAERIWYGAPTSQEPVLKKAMTKLVPDLVKSDKSVWLSSDTVMVPPTMLADEGVSLSRTVQKSGQYIVVWPQAFSSSVCTGYTVSESVYFAPPEWLPIGSACFKELRVNCEPAVFSLQQLLWNIARDSRTTTDVLKRVLPLLQTEIEEELEVRRRLKEFGVNRWEKLADPVEAESASNNKKRRPPSTVNEEDEECELCRSSLFFSRVELHSPKDVDDPTIWCLTHALEKIKERSKLIQQIRIRYAHEEDELKELLQTMRDQIKIKTVRRNVPQQKH